MISNRFVTSEGRRYDLQCHVAAHFRRERKFDRSMLRDVILRYAKRTNIQAGNLSVHVDAVIRAYKNEEHWETGIVNFIYRTRDCQ